MAQVVVTVNGRPYTMQCDDGQEEHLTELGQLLDDEVTTIKGSVGQVGDIRLLLMSGLVIADRLSDALKRIEEGGTPGEGGGWGDGVPGLPEKASKTTYPAREERAQATAIALQRPNT